MDVAAIPSVAFCDSILVTEFCQRFVSGWNFVVALFCGICSVELEKLVRC